MPTISRLAHTKAVLLFASTMTVMSGAIIAPALPGISRHFSEHPQVLIQLILTLPALMITLFSPLMGYLADRFGRKPLLLLMLSIYGLAGGAGFLIDSVELLLASRALMGVAVAGILSISTTLVGDYLEGSERVRFLGLQSSCMALGGVVFINLGGLLSDWSWRGPFLLYLTGVLLLPYAWAMLREPHSQAGAKAIHAEEPVKVDLGRTALAYFTGMLAMMLFYMFPAQLPFLLSEQGEISGLAIGIALSTAAFTASIVSFCYGYYKPFLSVMTIYVVGFVLAGAGFFVVGTTHSYTMAIIGAAISGLGLGAFMPNTTAWLMRITPQRVRGRVFGGFTATFFFGQFISPIAVAPAVVWLESLRNVYLGMGVLCCLLAIFMGILGKTYLRADSRL
ncbi:putative MFS family arabinose efflux permease [Vreelandella songnenensis]|uniref:Putative MFS family arabinose efflux permease n=1 Tax=Vreelandella songnenensis TaxID=1176243 RepID=A0A2T0V2M9_9GAMM|nr:MFS transporter [Halomonas songnenensis]PRY64436.1 putative MFS family arabinose efflux permease [Halomonas songnenensis]